VDPRAGLDDVEKRKFLSLPGLELQSLGRPARQPLAIPTEQSRLPHFVLYSKFVINFFKKSRIVTDDPPI
jgi:hypothetical protein